MTDLEAPTAAAEADLDGVADACSHQLGEADAIISGYLELLRARGPGDADALRAIDGGVRRTRRVLQDLLELARADQGPPVARAVTV
ncbi:histidine kinase dimerization/phospho-acceptor domain-containing protein, partial [Patulibacter sp. S7RM1-6]